jgi:oligopeptidase B
MLGQLTRRAVLCTTSLCAWAALFPTGVLQAKHRSKWPRPPQPPKVAAVVGNYGHVRADDYAWLKPKDWHAVLRDPASLEAPIKAVIDAEADYYDTILAATKPLQATLRQRAVNVAANNPPLELEYGEFRYFDRPVSGSPHRQYLRRPVAGGPEQLLLDLSKRAARTSFFALGDAGLLRSRDHRLIGWAEDLTGSGIFRVCVQEIATGRMLVDDLDETHGEFTFDPSGRHLFWVGRGPNGNPNSVWRRDIGSGRDVRVHAEQDPGFFIDVKTLASGAFVSIRLFNGAQEETRLIPAGDPTATPVIVEPRAPDLRYTVDHWNDRLLILTDTGGAADMKIMTAPIATPGRAHWSEFLPHRPGRFIVALHPFRHHLIREEWRDTNPHLVVMRPDGSEQELSFQDPAYAIEVPLRQDWDASSLVFVYQTPRLPPQRRRLIFATGRIEVEVTGSNRAYDPERYEVLRLEAPDADGVRVPITLLRARGAPRDGRAPLLLYGYGSYGVAAKADFDASLIALVDRGWSCAIAHVRGGSEKGALWWRSVLTTGKKKTFTDFIACAEYLIVQRYTARKRIVAYGFSAGGLLMGAIYCMRPDLWAGVVARAPFVDPVNDMDAFESHPLGKTALPIWGDPRIPSEYEYMLSYSPYDNLRRLPYPALLATGSLTDDRVSFTDPLKFAVKARALTTASDPIIVQIASGGGHVGTPGTDASLERNALFHAFAIWAVDRRWGNVPQR